MGGCKSRLSDTASPVNAPVRDIKIVVFGLDNSGKSTILANLNGDSTDGITPTIGFSSIKLSRQGCTTTLYDIGGGPRIRGIWKNYFSEAYGIIYVVDSCCPERYAESKNALKDVLSSDKINGKPLLVFANKQDLDGASDESDLTDQMELNELLGESRQLFTVMKCVGLRQGSKGDMSLNRGLDWLLGRILSRYDELSERVHADVVVQREIEAEERRQRMERVRKIREERERQRALNGETVDGEEEHPPANPFKPISVAIEEAEQREKALKEAKRSRDQQPTTSVAENTSHQATLDASHEDSAYTSPGPSAPAHRRSSAVSQPSSGLSESQSLTDVTVTGDGSSESLNTSLPLDPVPLSTNEGHSRTGSPIVRHRKLEPIKKEKKNTLLTRLKNRNKTMPISDPLPAKSTGSFSVSHNNWTEGDVEVEEDPLQGLPSLPPIKKVLPPIQISKQHSGAGRKSFHIEQELTVSPQSGIVQVSYPPPVEQLCT